MKSRYNLAALHLFTLAIFSTFYSTASAQETLPADFDYEPISLAFIEAFNDGEVDPFRAHFDEAMKGRNSSEKLTASFGQLKAQIGAIYAFDLQEVDGNTYAFRSVHEKMTSLRIAFVFSTSGALTQLQIARGTKDENTPQLERNISEFALPFEGEWYVFWGGTTTADNYHNAHASMRGAYDFWVMGENGLSHKPEASSNEDFYAFGQEIVAPVAGKVIYVTDELADNDWPAIAPSSGFGNLILLETENQEYVLFAHLQQHSVQVEKGQMVSQGETLGRCGNSGNSTEPHLHFQLLNTPDLGTGEGAWIHFDVIQVDGEKAEDYLPKKGEKVKNLD